MNSTFHKVAHIKQLFGIEREFDRYYKRLLQRTKNNGLSQNKLLQAQYYGETKKKVSKIQNKWIEQGS